MRLNIKTLVLLAFLGGFGFLVVSNFGEQVGGYEPFAEAQHRGHRAHIVGTWEAGRPMAYDKFKNEFSFWMRDEQGTVRQVVYRNLKPANFEDAEQVVVEGRFEGDVFVAQHILVKCPSKYNDAGQEFQSAPTQPTSAG